MNISLVILRLFIGDLPYLMGLFFTILKKQRDLISFAPEYNYKAFKEGRNAKTKSSWANLSHVSIFYFCCCEGGTIWWLSQHADNRKY
ncbi:hypothetical protein THZG08_140103 [Vibrio owensii]|uniref:Uncharacterized protein n=1 Tax=Vibrio owensii TaxID=696485 RepID=A0AAU9Q046_9VIBR|nr:hypothetical protein THZG08_140103 [Vibrio owensii]CAH1522540.1 hypothetical protein THF1D04_110019 [Vibrio owensii]